MAGVEILAMEEVATKFAFNWNSCWIVAGIVFLLFVVIGTIAATMDRDWKQFFIFVLVGVIAGVVFGGIAGAAFKTPIEYETQYKVTISDEVSMNDFLDKYEIVDQEGKIYTVRERND